MPKKKHTREEALLNAAQEWRNTFDAIGNGVALLDKEGRVMRCNTSMAAFIGRPFKEILGRPCYEVIHNASERIKDCPFRQVENKLTRASSIFSKDGQWFLVTVDPVLDGSGKFAGAVHIISDITEHKELEKTQRLAQLGKLVADMAHEVNNPLMIISGFAQLALMEEVGNEVIRASLTTIIEESQKAKDIIQRLLKFSRPSKGELKETAINDIIENVVRLVEHQFELVGVKIIRKYAPNLPMLSVDEQQMQEVFINILNNAKDAMPKGGVIKINTSVVRDSVKLEFRDTGAGMSEEAQKRLFEPFFTTKEKGTGLGLSVCYGIIKAHNGELKIKNESGKGVSAVIFLPLKMR